MFRVILHIVITILALTAETDGFCRYRMERQGLDAYFVARQADLEEKGVEEALRDAGLRPDQLILSGSTAIGDWHANLYHLDGAELNVALAWQARGGGTVYALVVTGSTKAMPGEPPAAVMRLLGSPQFSEAAGDISQAATRNGRIIYRYATGPAGFNTPTAPEVAYHYGSMTKLVTAVAVMKLVESKAVDLDAPIARYLPEFPGVFGITVRNLLTHSSGLPDREVTHLVLGILVGGVSRMPYESFVAQSILRPLGMEHTVFHHSDEPAALWWLHPSARRRQNPPCARSSIPVGPRTTRRR